MYLPTSNQTGDLLSWNEFIVDIKKIIVEYYDEEDPKHFKALWKHAFKFTANNFNLKTGAINLTDEWAKLEKELPLQNPKRKLPPPNHIAIIPFIDLYRLQGRRA